MKTTGNPENTLSCVQSRKNRILSRRTYSDTSAELVEARGDWQVLDMFKSFTTTPEKPVNVSELLKSPARNAKAKCE